MSYQLIPVSTPAHWDALHSIRRTVLFEGRHVDVEYDAGHPDDRMAGNIPLVLMLDGEPIGVSRLDDLGNGTGAVRLVAIRAELQRRGHGRALGIMVDDLARSSGMHTLYVNAAEEAVGYYQTLGWELYEWDASQLAGIASTCVQMRKCLNAA